MNLNDICKAVSIGSLAVVSSIHMLQGSELSPLMKSPPDGCYSPRRVILSCESDHTSILQQFSELERLSSTPLLALKMSDLLQQGKTQDALNFYCLHIARSLSATPQEYLRKSSKTRDSYGQEKPNHRITNSSIKTRLLFPGWCHGDR
ncbi:MAG: hypothetical protein LBJ92_03970 [Holosporales bacterium]|jgi:hypothetical protein|nr:hypothetical protein [Holosporales bacterium]